MKINLGCGKCFFRGWNNVDQYKASTCPSDVTFSKWNICKRFPIADNSVDVIYTEHVLEHMTMRNAHLVLAECYRVLKPGSRIRIVVPDAIFRKDPEHPAKDVDHDTFWTYQTLSWMTRTAGLVPKLLRYHDAEGTLHQKTATDIGVTPKRPGSLIIDGIKESS